MPNSIQTTDTLINDFVNRADGYENTQTTPHIIKLTGGGFVIAWSSFGQSSLFSYDSYFQVYYPDGTPKGGQVLIGGNSGADHPFHDDIITNLHATDNGGFTASLIRHSSNTGSNYLHQFFFDGNGDPYYPNSPYNYGYSSVTNSPVGEEVDFLHLNNIVETADDGALLIANTHDQAVEDNVSFFETSPNSNIYAHYQTFEYSGFDTSVADIVKQAGDTYLLILEKHDVSQNGLSSGVIQQYDRANQQFTEIAQVGTGSSHDVSFMVKTLTDGSFLVMWNSNRFGQGTDVFMQHFSLTGQALSTELQVNLDTAGDQQISDFVQLPDGSIFVQYAGPDQDGLGMFGQRIELDGTHLGSAIQINTVTLGDQVNIQHDSLIVLDNGDLVSAWTAENLPSGYGNDIAARIIEYSTLPTEPYIDPTNPSIVNTTEAGHQYEADVSTLENGNYVVSWRGPDENGSGVGIFGQLFNSNGQKIGDEFQVNTITPERQDHQEVIPLIGGGFVITWTSFAGTKADIKFQIYNPNGEPVGGEQLANTYVNYNQYKSDGLSLENGPDGGFILFWSTQNQDGSGFGIIGQKFSGDGTKIGAEFIATQVTIGNQSFEKVIELSDGSLVILYASPDANQYGLYAQHLDANGQTIGGQVKVNTFETGNQIQPDIIALPTGGFIVVWKSQASGEYTIKTQAFDNTLTPVATEQTIYDNFPDLPHDPQITLLADGGYLIAWQGRSAHQLGRSDILAQRFDENHNAIGDTIAVFDNIKAQQENPGLASLPNGNVVITWEERGTSQEIWSKTLSFSPSNGHDHILGDNTNNLISALDGDDYINGYGGNDTLIGGDGVDNIKGGDGDDVITMGAGHYDTAEGGAGADIFVFGLDENRNRITDFEVGTDKIDLSSLNLDFTDLTIQPLGTSTLITVGGSTQIELQNIAIASIDETSFIL